MNKTIHIILPVHNRRNVTCRFIKQLKRQTCQNFSIILIDDGCVDETCKSVHDIDPQITTIKGDGGLWWAGSLQKAYELLSRLGDTNSLVMIANDDTIFEDDFLEKSVAQLKLGTMLIPKVFVGDTQIDGGARVVWSPFSLGLHQDPNCCSTRCLLLSIADFIRIGKWHTKLLPHYLSDTEWTYRGNKLGIKIVEGESVHVLREEDETKSTKLFSKRNPYNPVYYSLFIILSCPIKYLLINLFQLWYRTLRTFAVKMIHKVVKARIHSASGKWFSRGAWLTLTLNTNCNFRCPDCPLWIGQDKFPIWKQCSIEQWKEFIGKTFPQWISLVSICGGEPTLLKWLAEFVNWLLDGGHHVGIYTNLCNVDELLKIKRSSRLMINATYHHEDNKERFMRAYNLLKGKYRISVHEFESPMKLPCSIPKEHLKGNFTVDFNNFHCAPNAPITRAVYCGGEDRYGKPVE